MIGICPYEQYNWPIRIAATTYYVATYAPLCIVAATYYYVATYAQPSTQSIAEFNNVIISDTEIPDLY